jgi:glycerophosphoryl diester phosphodiesterase
VTIAIAHRGDPIGHRENTLPAFEAAVRLGADTLQRLWGLDRAVGDLDLAQVQALGQGDQRIPTFRQVLHDVAVPLMVDFTGDEVVVGALAAAQEARAMDRSLFVTGHVGALRKLRGHSRSARIGLTWIEAEPPAPVLLEELDAEFWNPYFRLATPEQVAAVHRLGLRVSTWTVDKPRHMARVAEAGVDAIVSNKIADLTHFLA